MFRTVMILLCINNLLNIILPRYAEDSGSLRLPIQAISMIVLLLVITSSFLYQKKNFKKFLRAVKYFLLYALSFLLIYIVFSPLNIDALSNFLKMILWLSSILFFSKYGYLAFGKYKKYMQFFVITFLAASAKKIFEAADFSAEDLVRGDFVGLTTVMVIPSIFLFFKGKYQNILLTITIVLVLATVRRSAIIALAAIMPFIFRELKAKLKFETLLILAVLFIGGFAVAWEYFGGAVTQRFASLIEGDNTYQADESYGSGRSIFYLIVLNSWWKSDLLPQILGHGLSSVRDLLKKEYSDIGHAHNDYLESLYAFGAIGFMLYLNILYRTIKIRKLLKVHNRERLNIHAMAVISILIISLSSGTFYRAEMIVFSIPLGTIISDFVRKENSEMPESTSSEVLSIKKVELQT